MNFVDTTVSLSARTVSLLHTFSRKRKITTRLLVVRAACKAVADNSSLVRSIKVSYQSLDAPMKRIHIAIPADLYEMLTDIRSSAKISVSKMIVDALLELINENQNARSDSYRQYAYRIRKIVRGNKIITLISWRIKPPEGKTPAGRK